MRQLRGIARRSTSGTNIIPFPTQPHPCVGMVDPLPRGSRSRQASSSVAYRISQIVRGRAVDRDKAVPGKTS